MNALNTASTAQDTARAIFDARLAQTSDADERATLQLLRAYFTDPQFRRKLEDFMWEHRVDAPAACCVCGGSPGTVESACGRVCAPCIGRYDIIVRREEASR